MKRIFLFFLLVSTAFSMRAQQASYTISLQEAVWNFDDYEGTKPSVSSSSYLVPQNWIIGNGGSSKNSAAYCPFIYPYTGDATSSYGYDGRLCLRIYHNASTSRTAPFAVLPLIRDVDYSQLQLTFMGKGEQSSSSATYSNRLRIGYITSLADTLKANFNAAVVNFHDEVLPTSGYQQYTISLSGIPTDARIVLYDDDPTVHNSIMLDNIRITQDPNSVTQPEPSSASKVTVYAYYPDLIALFKWDVLISSNAGTTFVAADILDSINTYDPNTTIDGIPSGFINEITVVAPDGVTYDGATAQAASESGMGYWMYNLNDQLAPSGIAGQTIVAGDVIFWEFKTDWSNWELTQLANVPSNVYSVDFGVVNAAPIQHDTTAISCGAFTWEGQTYTQSGDYSISKQTANGTEQLTLHLTINQSYYFDEYLTACDSMEWKGTTYTESGDYTFSDTTVSGCDSTTVLHLTINKSTYEERSETHTDSLIWNGQIFKESGDYIFSDTTVNGCDSTIVLHLTIEPTSALSNTTLQVAVWPNPTTEVLHLQAEGGTEIYIFDATGQLVIRQPYADTLNVSTLPSGMYLIRLQTTNGQTATTPFIKK